MNGSAWAILVLAGSSAGVFCGAILAVSRGRWPPGHIPISALLVAVALFAFSRAFAGAAPYALCAIFSLIAFVQISRAQSAPALQKALALVPVSAMFFVAAGQLSAPPGSDLASRVLVAVLCAPLPIAAIAALLLRTHLINPRGQRLERRNDGC